MPHGAPRAYRAAPHAAHRVLQAPLLPPGFAPNLCVWLRLLPASPPCRLRALFTLRYCTWLWLDGWFGGFFCANAHGRACTRVRSPFYFMAGLCRAHSAHSGWFVDISRSRLSSRLGTLYLPAVAAGCLLRLYFLRRTFTRTHAPPAPRAACAHAAHHAQAPRWRTARTRAALFVWVLVRLGLWFAPLRVRFFPFMPCAPSCAAICALVNVLLPPRAGSGSAS